MSDNTQDVNESNILKAVQQLGIGGSKLSLNDEFRGGQCRVYKISSTDDVNNQLQQSFAVRIPLYMPDRQESINVLQAEWQVLRTLHAKGFTWAPKPIQCSLNFDNPIKFPFLILSWVDGSKACWNEIVPARPLRDRFLSQLATIQSSLIECTLELCRSHYPPSPVALHLLNLPQTLSLGGNSFRESSRISAFAFSTAVSQIFRRKTVMINMLCSRPFLATLTEQSLR